MMIDRLNRILKVVLVVVFLCVITLWLTLRKEQTDPVVPRTPVSEQSDLGSESSEEAHGPDAPVSTEEEHLTPEEKKLIEVVQGPDYEKFAETNPMSLREFSDFFQSQGVPVPANDMLDAFKKMAPEGSPEALEREMRAKLAAIYLAADIDAADIESGNKAAMDALNDAFITFLTDKQNVAWMMTHFEGDYFAAAEWTLDIVRDVSGATDSATPSVFVVNNTEILPEGVPADTVPSPEVAEERDPVEIPGRESADSVLTDQGSPVSPEQIERAADEAIEPPSMEQIETQLRDQFSPERFSRAMETLRREGPEEGLRRIKSSDPEMAVVLERLLKNRE